MTRKAAAAVVASAFALVGCNSGLITTDVLHPSPNAGKTCTIRATPDCSGYTYVSPTAGTVIVTAPKGSGENDREFFWGRNGGEKTDQTVCATFADGGGIDQQGIGLRLNETANGGTTGITVTRNIWMATFDVFNFHVWNTRSGTKSPFTLFGSKVIPWLPRRPAMYPLHMCARVVATTNSVQFVVWTRGKTQPAWGSTTQGGEATIPVGAPSAGRGGWFAGHLTPGTSMTYRDLTVDGAPADGLP